MNSFIKLVELSQINYPDTVETEKLEHEWWKFHMFLSYNLFTINIQWWWPWVLFGVS